MDLFEIAIELEHQGVQFYTELAKTAPTEGFASIFRMLAEDEKKHEISFRALEQRNALVFVDSKTEEASKVIFKSFDPDKFKAVEGQVAIYEEALAIEKKSIDLYKQQLPSVVFEAEKKALTQILAEEERHYAILEEIIKLVSRPHRWVEDAEFGVREQY